LAAFVAPQAIASAASLSSGPIALELVPHSHSAEFTFKAESGTTSLECALICVPHCKHAKLPHAANAPGNGATDTIKAKK
jgi:hypothetical protein